MADNDVQPVTPDGEPGDGGDGAVDTLETPEVTTPPAPAPTAAMHATVHIKNAPSAPPIETGNSNPNSMPPASTAIVGTKISFAARRVGASSAQSRSQRSQRMPSASACC